MSRGSADSKKQSLGALKWHLAKKHPEVDNSGPPKTDPGIEQPKRSSDEICIWSCRTKKQRTELYQTTITDWAPPKNMMDRNNPKAQKMHRLIFEMIVLDLEPFNVVNKPGFLRNYALIAPYI